ncbi:MAG TPA: glycosyltransferase family 2 protein [Chitinophagales bacterium]|nr:glycosyltransferase family 2 protein [Chitinophagales bacterium]
MYRQQNPKVSIITVNYNQAAVTCEMLESLRALTWKNTEVLVVDNASAENCDVIKEKYPEVELIKSKTNLGFAGGNNLAIVKATGDYLLLINNDTEVSPGFIEPLLETFARHDKAGVVSPKIVFYYTNNLIQYAGTNKINPLTCRGETVGYMQKNDGRFDSETRTDLSHGACMIFSREVLDKVGIMDDSYFLFYEEYDYCERVKRAGFDIYYNGQSQILHKQSVSVGKASPMKSYFMTRNRIYFSRKNFSGLNRLSAVAYTYMIAIPVNLLRELIQGRWQNSLAIARGAWWNLFHSPQRV